MKDISERCDDYIQYAEAVKKFHDLDFYKQAKAEIDRLRARLAEIEGQEPVAWPLASPEDADKGWTLDYRFIEQVERIASQHTDYTTSMEATEQVLIAANEVLRASQPVEQQPVGVQGEACVACEDKPAPGNNPCGWCGRTTPPSAPVDGAIDKARFKRAPCYLCGYNGPGYYQPDTHPCAAKYHAALAAHRKQGDSND